MSNAIINTATEIIKSIISYIVITRASLVYISAGADEFGKQPSFRQVRIYIFVTKNTKLNGNADKFTVYELTTEEIAVVENS